MTHASRLALLGMITAGAVLSLNASAQSVNGEAGTSATTTSGAPGNSTTAQNISGESTLPELTVTTTAVPNALPKPFAGGQLARGGRLGILGNTDVLDTPFNTTNYTSEILRNQQSRTLADVVVNDPSVRVLTSAGGFGDDFLIRGFSVPSGDVGLNGLFGLASASRMPAEAIERVDVLKGPGALLNGISPSGSIGGGLNVTTKRAADTPLTRLTTTYRSDSQFGVQADIGRRFGRDNEWGVRFNGSYRNGEANLNDQRQKVAVGALGIDYNGGRVRWSLDALTQAEDINNLRGQIAFLATSPIPAAPSNDLNFVSNTPLTLRDNTIATRLEIDLTDRVTAYGAFGTRHGSADQTFAAARSGTANGNFTLNYGYYDSNTETYSAETGLRGRFDTGSVGHQVVLSASRLEQTTSAFSPASFNIASSINNPVAVPAISTVRQVPSRTGKVTLSSIALADTLSMFDKRLLITLGARNQSVDDNATYDKQAVTPMAGVVYKVTDKVSVYGNYIEGLTRGNTAPVGSANAGEVFAPYKSKQKEAGLKFETGSLINTLSVFQIDKPSAITDPVTLIYSADGQQRNRGIEFNTSGEVARGVRLMAGAAFTKAELTRTAGGVNQGNEPAGVPKKTFNLGGEWDLPGVSGLSLNARAIHTGAVHSNVNNRYQFPSWTRYDAGLRYVTRIDNKPVTLRASVENLTDKNFWVLSGTFASVSVPRTFVISASMDF